MEYVSPLDDRVEKPAPLAPRPRSLVGARVALLDISKRRGAEYLDRLEHRLREMGATTTRHVKPTFARPAPQDLIEEIARDANIVVEALAD